MPRSPGTSSWRMRKLRSDGGISRSRRRGALRPVVDERELQEQRALQQVVEVIVGNHRDDGLAAGAPVHGQTLHVVDLEARIALEERAAGDARARPDLVGCDLAQAHLHALAPAEIALEDEQAAVR